MGITRGCAVGFVLLDIFKNTVQKRAQNMPPFSSLVPCLRFLLMRSPLLFIKSGSFCVSLDKSAISSPPLLWKQMITPRPWAATAALLKTKAGESSSVIDADVWSLYAMLVYKEQREGPKTFSSSLPWQGSTATHSLHCIKKVYKEEII